MANQSTRNEKSDLSVFFTILTVTALIMYIIVICYCEFFKRIVQESYKNPRHYLF